MKSTFKHLAAAVAMLGASNAAMGQETPKTGGTYSFAVTLGDPDTLDCHATNSIASLYRLAPQYSLLLKYDPNNYPSIIGDLAESWTISDDGLTYTFAIRSGVVFHDGSTLNSTDIKASFDRLKTPKDGTISVRQSHFLDIASIEAPDENTFVVKLSKPNSSMLEVFAGPYNCIYSAEQLASDPDYPAKKVNGTGPFRFESQIAGAEWNARRFENYFVKGKPYVDAVKMLNMPKPAAINAMSAGQVPGIFPSLSQADVDRIKSARGDNVVTFDAINTTVMFGVAFNTAKPPFNDIRVRQALNLAIDRRTGSKFLAKIASANGFGTLMRPGSDWERDEAEIESIPGFSKDVKASREEARRLLKEAGMEDLKFVFLNWNRFTPIGVFLIDQWRQIGVQVTQETLDVGAFFKRQKTDDYTVVFDAIAEYSDDPTLRFSKLISVGKNPTNLTRIEDPIFDELYEKQKRTLDKKERIGIVRDLEDHLMKQAAWIPTFWSVRPMVLDKNIKGLLTPHIASNYVALDQSTVWIDD